ncbi:MAG: VWA domain-containing protein [Planctomycetota bacterium]
MLTILYPWLFVLLPAPWLVRWALPPRRASSVAVRVPFLSRIQAAGGQRPTDVQAWQTTAIKLLIWMLLVVALSRPQWLEPPMERTIPTRDLLLLVDLSASMEEQDFTNLAGEPTDRLQAVKEVLDEFLAKRGGDRVGLVVFGSSPFLQVPLTTDLDVCQQLLQETAVGMAGPRTALGDAIGLGIGILEESDTPEKTMIALTDGNDTVSAVPPIEAARVARDRDMVIHTVAIGDPTTVGEEKLDEQALREVAAVAGGEYFLALNREELAGIYDRLDQIETKERKTVSHRPRRDLYAWPLGLALLSSFMAAFPRVGSESRRQPPAGRRVRVNSRTFQLEAVEA